MPLNNAYFGGIVFTTMTQLELFDYDDYSDSANVESVELNNQISKKVCRICRVEKSTEEFYLDRGAIYSKCKDCCKEYSIGLNEAKKNAPDKPDKCECCGKSVDKWYCDHHPQTSKFRGWICFNCNNAAGSVGDSYEGAVNLLNYLYNRRSV